MIILFKICIEIGIWNQCYTKNRINACLDICYFVSLQNHGQITKVALLGKHLEQNELLDEYTNENDAQSKQCLQDLRATL